jgi:hypothetical protein
MKHIAELLSGAYGWLQIKCHRCETGSIPLDANRRSRDTARRGSRRIAPADFR